MTELDLAALRALAVDLAREAAHVARAQRPARLGVADTKSSHTDVVTVMDRLVEDHLVARLRDLRPGDAVYGEERGEATGSSGLTWVLDPIDGTVNYLYDRGSWCVSVAVVRGDPSGTWEPLAGAVADPTMGVVFHGALGLGSQALFDSGEVRDLAANDPVTPDAALVATGFSYVAETRREQGRVVAQVVPQVRDIRRAGSAALDLCAVAAGWLDAYYESGLKPWDMAAGLVIAREAGAVVTDLHGAAPSGGMTLAAGRMLHTALLGVLLSAGASGGGAT